MASAELVPPVPVRQRVLLDLSYEEACTLRVVTIKIGGHIEASPRGHVDAIGDALSLVLPDWEDMAEYRLLSGGLHFDNYPHQG